MIIAVEDRLKMMFVENTGIHFLDSGGVDGRRWQYNQKNHPCDAPDVKFEGNENWHTFTVNAYKHLLNILDTDDLCNRFNDFNEGDEDLVEDDELSEMMDEVGCPVPFTRKAYNLLADRIIKVKRSYYTYNYDCVLDHDMIVSEIVARDDDGYDEAYVLISLHLGCDARGGFGTGFLFKESHWSEFNVCPSVYGYVERDGTEFRVSNDYDGISLTVYETDEGYKFQVGDVVHLDMSS